MSVDWIIGQKKPSPTSLLEGAQQQSSASSPALKPRSQQNSAGTPTAPKPNYNSPLSPQGVAPPPTVPASQGQQREVSGPKYRPLVSQHSQSYSPQQGYSASYQAPQPVAGLPGSPEFMQLDSRAQAETARQLGDPQWWKYQPAGSENNWTNAGWGAQNYASAAFSPSTFLYDQLLEQAIGAGARGLEYFTDEPGAAQRTYWYDPARFSHEHAPTGQTGRDVLALSSDLPKFLLNAPVDIYNRWNDQQQFLADLAQQRQAWNQLSHADKLRSLGW